MSLHFIVIGLVCNSLGCYWSPIEKLGSFDDQTVCASTAYHAKLNSVMYFDTSCVILTQEGIK